MPQQIVVTKVGDNYITPIPSSFNENKNWSYSFKYFKQIDYFGLDKSGSKWFVSLIERLKDLSNTERKEVFSDKTTKEFYRYHKIDWASKNIPIKKDSLDWVDKAYLLNDDEFPFYQFMISKANGRIVGFWNETHTIFYIVLLDPLHNLQPSKDFNYKVNDCYPLSCEYSSIMCDVQNIGTKESNCEDCNIKSEIAKIPIRLNDTNAIIGYLDKEFLKEYEKISGRMSISEILELGILNAIETKK